MARLVKADNTLSDEMREEKLAALQLREDYEGEISDRRRELQVEEIQWAEEWTYEYGDALFKLIYQKEDFQHDEQGNGRDITTPRGNDGNAINDDRGGETRLIRLRHLKMAKQSDLLVVRDASTMVQGSGLKLGEENGQTKAETFTVTSADNDVPAEYKNETKGRMPPATARNS